MRVLIQRVSEASVDIEEGGTKAIGQGLVIFVGIEDADTPEDAQWLSKKVAKLRIFPDAEGLMNLSLKDVAGEVLVVSQFTLHASTKKGNRPSYIRASKPEVATPLYNSFIQQMEEEIGKKVQTGEFGAMMDVSLVNHGPVTIFIDSKNKE